MVEVNPEDQNKVKRMKRAEDSLRDICDNMKSTNVRIIGVQEEERKKGYEKSFDDLVDNFSNMEKKRVNQVQEAHRVAYRINPRRNTPRHILIKLTKTETQRKNIKSSKGKQQVTYKGNPIGLTTDLSATTLQAKREWQDIKY